MSYAANRDSVGFTLHTTTSLVIPGPWGALALIWPPAAYAEALRQAQQPPADRSSPE